MPTVTEAAMQSRGEAKRGRRARRGVVAVMAVFVLAGALGWFGYRQATVASSGGGHEIEVSYPRITRGGLLSTWELRVGRADGGSLPDEVVIRSTANYFDRFDQRTVDPVPASTWSNGDVVEWTFAPPEDATTLAVRFVARLQPESRGWFDGRTALVVDRAVVAEVEYRSWAVP